jgi:hypothetical protein
MIEEEFKLQGFELQSALWIKLAEYYKFRLEVLRAKNDGHLSELDTARLRGEIKAVKHFLALGNPVPGEGIND